MGSTNTFRFYLEMEEMREEKASLPPRFLMRKKEIWRRRSFEKQYIEFSLDRLDRQLERRVWLSRESSAE